jgi:hypothetical protein
MSSPIEPRAVLSSESSERLNHALLLSQELQAPSPDADAKLATLRTLLDECRDGIRREKPSHGKHRIEALNKARNYLHFMPSLQHPQATSRLQGVARRIQTAMRSA